MDLGRCGLCKLQSYFFNTSIITSFMTAEA